MKTTAAKSLFGRLWKKVILISGLALVLLLVWVTARFNITPERSRPLAQLQRLIGFHQPAPRAVVDDLAIVGHRGSGSGIGNTLGAIARGIDTEGVDWIEVDIRRCGGELILFHDATIDQWLRDIGSEVHEGERRVGGLTLASLREIQGEADEEDRVVSLREVFRRYPPTVREIRWILDIKETGLGGEMLEVLGEAGFEEGEYRERIILLGGFDIIGEYGESGYARAYAAGWSEGVNALRFLFGHGFIVDRCVSLGDGLDYLALPEMFVNASLLRSVKEAKPGLKVFTYLGNTPESWRKSVDFGVDGLIVDDVASATRAFRTGGSRP